MGKWRVVLVAWLLVSCAQTKVVAPRAVTQDWTCVAPDASEEGALACAVVDALFAQARLAKAEPVRVVLSLTDTGFDATVERGATQQHVALPLKSHVFAPATWAPLVSPLIGKPEPGSGMVVSPALEALANDPSAASVATQAARVSALLERAPRQSFPHLEAGVVLAVLAWREGGVLADPRELLTLATAQLAIASGLWPGNVGPRPYNELVAWSLIDTLVSSREDHRDGMLSGWAPTPWVPMLEVLVDGNWKQHRGGAGGLARLLRVRVLAERAGSGALDAEYEAWGMPEDPFFSRVVFGAGERPVATTRLHADSLRVREAAERAAVEPLLSKTANVVPEVVWRRHLSRNALNAALVTEEVLTRVLSLPDAGRAAFEDARQALGTDPLWPAAQFLFTRARIDRRACASLPAEALLVPFLARTFASLHCNRAPPMLEVPRGTVFDADHRFMAPRLAKVPAAQREAWLAISPSAFGPRLLELRELPAARMTTDRAWDVMGPLMEYDRRALEAVATAVPRPSKELLERVCESEPSSCGSLVAFLRASGQPFLEALERWRKDPGSRVAFSNFARPLVDHYLETKRQADAEALVAEVAATGSSRGLEIQAVFLERQGRYRDAERAFRTVVERYGEPFLLRDFYFRAGARKYERGQFATQARDAERALFGGPPQKVTKAQLSPTDRGLDGSDPVDLSLVPFGLRPSDVLLAVDGVRVQTREQALAMLHRTEPPRLVLLLARDGQVIELAGQFRRQRYGR